MNSQSGNIEMPRSVFKRAAEIRKAQAFKELYSRYFSRHFSFIITALLTYTPITPNQVTISMVAFGWLGAALMCFGEPLGFLLGGLSLAMLNIADAVDGELARYKGLTSTGGDYLDRVAHYVTNSGAILGSGVGLYLQYDQLFILLIACLIEIIYTFDEVSRDLLVTCGLQKEEGNRKELKGTTKIAVPSKFKLFLEITSTNLAFFHLLALFGLLDWIAVEVYGRDLTDIGFVLSYCLFFASMSVLKASIRITKIKKAYF